MTCDVDILKSCLITFIYTVSHVKQVLWQMNPHSNIFIFFKCLGTSETHFPCHVYSVRPLSTTGFSSAARWPVQIVIASVQTKMLFFLLWNKSILWVLISVLNIRGVISPKLKGKKSKANWAIQVAWITLSLLWYCCAWWNHSHSHSQPLFKGDTNTHGNSEWMNAVWFRSWLTLYS